MMASIITFLVVLMFGLQGFSSLEFSSEGLEENSSLTICKGKPLVLDWRLNVTDNAKIIDTLWFYHGRSDLMIAMASHGYFNPTSSFHGRVTQRGRAGLEVVGLTAGNNGRYSLEVNAIDQRGSPLTLRRNATVRIVDGLQTADGSLHASQLPDAEYDVSTRQHHVVLRCGNFTYAEPPTFSVVWTTPSDQQVNSSDFRDGHFRLRLRNPVQGGSYVCSVPAGQACTHGNHTAAVTVDGVEARLAVLGGQVSGLTGQLATLEAENKGLKQQLAAQGNVTSSTITAVESKVASLERQVVSLTGHVTDLQSENEELRQLNNETTLKLSSLLIENVDLKTQLLINADQDNLTSQALDGITSQNAVFQSQLLVIAAQNNVTSQTLGNLMSQNAAVQSQLLTTDNMTSQALNDLTSQFTNFQSQLLAMTAKDAALTLALDNVTVSLEHLTQRAGSANVSFLARDLKNIQPSFREDLVFRDIVHNAGQGYSNVTGRFTAPTAGTYVVLAGLQGLWRHNEEHRKVEVYLVKDGVMQGYVSTDLDPYTQWDASSIQIVLRLGKGQQVWLQAGTIENRLGHCWFSAALLAVDA